MNRKLKVFLCHSSDDKPAVRELYNRLNAEGWIDPWLDEEKLYPGQDWDREIEIAVEESESVLILLSKESVEKESYVQYELRSILHIAKYKPAGVIFVLPLRINDCEVPRSLRMWQHIDYFPENRKDWAYKRILGSLKMRAAKLGIDVESIIAEKKGVEQGKAKEERRKKIAAEKARKDKKRAERREQEKVEQEAFEKARKEREAKEKKEAEEKARKTIQVKTGESYQVDKAERVEFNRRVKARMDEASEDLANRIQKDKEKRAKNLPYFIGGGILFLFLIIYIIGKATVSPVIPVPTATEHPPTKIPATATEKPPTKVSATATKTSTQTPVPTPTLGIGSTMISEKDGMTLLYVPAGEFEMGNVGRRKYDEEPIHIMYLDSYWIDQTEVTNAMYAKCLEDGKCELLINDKSDTRDDYYGNAEFDNYPIINVSWDNANKYCIWANRRLPTEAEWEKAARGTDGRIYPWGDDEINQSYANYDHYGGDTTAVGVYENGKGFYGTYDMIGNVEEWVADWYDRNYYANSPTSNPLGPDTGYYRVIRGGSWSYNMPSRLDSILRQSSLPSLKSNRLGFRCALSP